MNMFKRSESKRKRKAEKRHRRKLKRSKKKQNRVQMKETSESTGEKTKAGKFIQNVGKVFPDIAEIAVDVVSGNPIEAVKDVLELLKEKKETSKNSAVKEVAESFIEEAVIGLENGDYTETSSTFETVYDDKVEDEGAIMADIQHAREAVHLSSLSSWTAKRIVNFNKIWVVVLFIGMVFAIGLMHRWGISEGRDVIISIGSLIIGKWLEQSSQATAFSLGSSTGSKIKSLMNTINKTNK